MFEKITYELRCLKETQNNMEPLFDKAKKLIDELVGNDPMDIFNSGITKQDILDYVNLKIFKNPVIISLGIKSVKNNE